VTSPEKSEMLRELGAQLRTLTREESEQLGIEGGVVVG